MKYILHIFLIVLSINIMSCKKFLEETSPDIVIPTQVSHFEELLYGKGYPATAEAGFSKTTELLTDDVDWAHVPNPNAVYLPLKSYTTKEGSGFYMFQDDPEQEMVNGTDNNWQGVYKAINVCNVVINDLSGLKTDDEAMRKHVLGQAYALRAYHYLALMNMYGMPYVPGSDNEWGVPLKTSSQAEDRLYQRNTVHEVYNLIKSDIDKGVLLMDPDKKLKIYEMNWFAGSILATRIHLYMEEWQEVIKYGEAYLKRRSELPVPTAALTNGTTNPTMGLFMGFTASYSAATINPEVVFNYGTSPATFGTLYQANAGTGHFIVSNSLRAMYSKSLKTGEQDQRMTNPSGNTASWFFAIATTKIVPRKIHAFNTKRSTFRTGEIVMNLSEAYARISDIPKSLAQLNDLRASRIKNYAGLSAANFTKETLLEFIKDERRREFCFEDLRLPDLKRYGMPEQVHYIEDFTGRYKTTLSKGDYGYIYQIPLQERNINLEIKRIPRPVRQVEPY